MIKMLKHICLACVLLASISCKKSTFDLVPPAGGSLTISSHIVPYLNGEPNYLASRYYVNFTGRKILFQMEPAYDYYSGDYNINSRGSFFGIPAKPDFSIEILSALDTNRALIKRTFSPEPGAAYTWFLSGMADHPDEFLLKENLPVRKDSTFGVRFINLSSDAGVVSFNMPGESSGSVVEQLDYLQYSDFISYSAKAADPHPAFEARDRETGDLLATYSFDNYSNKVPRFGNCTLVLRGLANTSAGVSLEIIRVIH